MLYYINGKFESVEIFTNGTLISDEWVDYIAEHKLHIALSVYSYVPEEHDKVTKISGSWEKTNKTISKLKSKQIKYRVCNVLMNCSELGMKNTDLYELSKTKDVVRMAGRANFFLLSDDLIKKRLITKESFKFPIKKKICKKYISGHNCFKSRIYISADMNVYPCVMERRLKHCNIKNNKEIILDESIRNFTKERISGCCLCEYRYICHDCRPNSLSGNIYEKPWYCTYEPLSGKWIDPDIFIKKLRERWE